MSRLRKVSVLILSWNGRQHLEACLPALSAQEFPGCQWEILVLDNGSADGTGEWLRRAHPEVRLIESPVNLGFCAGNNRLVAAAEGDAVVFLNNDTRPRPGWLGALVEALGSAPVDVAAVSGRIDDWRGEHLDFARGLMTFDGHAFQQDFGRSLAEVELPAPGAELLFACGGNMIVRRQAFLAAGGFDESYFAYLEDVDLGWRLWSGGERILFAPEAAVHHRSMATSQLLGAFHRGFLYERNAFLTAYKNYQAGRFEEMMPAVLLTLIHRTQTLMVQNNPGGELLTLDPYAGHIANTGHPPPPEAEGPEESVTAPAGETSGETPPAASAPPSPSLAEKWRLYGPREFFRRGVRKAVRTALPGWILDDLPHAPRLTDERTIAQLRAVTQLLGNLDRAAAERRRVQSRRRRSDREIFERFPLYVVPTYPGDERLFGSPAFAEFLGAGDLPVVRAGLEELMRIRD
jgi:GT2 family glycosyltransferase